MSTLVRLKSELQAPTQPTNDSPEGLKAFRQTWAMAAAEGRHQQEALVAELRENLNALATENERLEGLVVAAQTRAQAEEEAKSRAESALRECQLRVQPELDAARAAAVAANARLAEALDRLAEAQAKHTVQINLMQTERDSAVNKAHEMELKLVRALALLEARESLPCREVESNHHS